MKKGEEMCELKKCGMCFIRSWTSGLNRRTVVPCVATFWRKHQRHQERVQGRVAAVAEVSETQPTEEEVKVK